jgi:hypothetical protein
VRYEPVVPEELHNECADNENNQKLDELPEKFIKTPG